MSLGRPLLHSPLSWNSRPTFLLMKTCKKCNQEKPYAEFNKSRMRKDGYHSQCRECRNKYDRAQWHKHKEKRLEYKDEYRKENKEQIKECSQNYYQANRAKISEKRQEPHKQRKLVAQRKVSNAIRKGELARSACWYCGEPNADAHHPDYDQPLSVVWLCRKHHFQAHAASI